MSFECSFGDKDEEEKGLNESAKVKDKEITIENILNDYDKIQKMIIKYLIKYQRGI